MASNFESAQPETVNASVKVDDGTRTDSVLEDKDNDKTITGRPRASSRGAESVLDARPVAPRHEFYQTPDTVVVSVFKKNLPEGTTVHFTETSVSVRCNQETIFDMDPLQHAIDVERSRYRLSSIKVELTLYKKDSGNQWTAVLGSDATITKANRSNSDASAIRQYPSSSKKRTNWSELEQTIAKDDEDNGDGGVNELLSKLYSGASDDQKRAMMKSMQESSGTVLSTNWEEVGKATVKPQPPTGMQEKKYNH